MEELGLRPLGAALCRSRRIDARAVGSEHHSIVLLRACLADEAAADIGQDAPGLAVEGMAPAAAAAGLDPHDVAPLDDIAIAQGAQDALVRPAGIDDAAPRPGRMSARDAPGWMLDAVDAHGDH